MADLKVDSLARLLYEQSNRGKRVCITWETASVFVVEEFRDRARAVILLLSDG